VVNFFLENLIHTHYSSFQINSFDLVIEVPFPTTLSPCNIFQFEFRICQKFLEEQGGRLGEEGVGMGEGGWTRSRKYRTPRRLRNFLETKLSS
jgi:hypothetical protein